MKEDSLFHRALAMGAAAFAIFGGVGGATPVFYHPPPVPPIATIVNSGDQQQEASQQVDDFHVKEIAAGTPPTQKFCVGVEGPEAYQSFHVAAPVHQARLFSWSRIVPTLEPPSAATSQQVPIRYQPVENGPQFQLTVPLDTLQAWMDAAVKQPVAVSPFNVKQITITPANDHQGETHVLPSSAATPQESHLDLSMADHIAAMLSILTTVSAYLKERRHGTKSETAKYAVEGGALVQTGVAGDKHILLSREALEKAQENERQTVQAWYESMQFRYNQWVGLWLMRDASPENAAALAEVQHAMCGVYTQFKQFLEKSGATLPGLDALAIVCQA